MARLRYPQDRIAYVYSGPGQPITMPGPIPVTVYVDQATTQLADITDLDGHALTGSVLHIGADGLIPEFFGPPNGASRLWGLTPASVPYEIDAQPGPRITAIEQGGSGGSYVHVQGPAASTWTINHNLGYRPAGIVVQDDGGTFVFGADLTYPSANTLTLTFSAALSGTAYLS